MSKEFFLEIGTEEIPAGFLPKAMVDMEALISKELKNARLTFGEILTLATPRRLVICVKEIPVLQSDAETTVIGPAKNIAFGSDNKPTKAAIGFARGQGVDAESLTLVVTDKGEYVTAVKKEFGRPTSDLLAEILPRFISGISFRKSMRWADLDVRFARPIHWIVSLFDGVVVPFTFGTVQSGNMSYGHRFMANRQFPVLDLNHYLEECERHFVIPDPKRRKDVIRREIHRVAKAGGGHLLPDEGLLEEVTFLCEYPSVVMGGFSTVFLDVPKEVLITSMRSHQRYFSAVDENGRLMPRFITVNNTLAEDPSIVVKGNERVLRARLSDACFFFEEDRKIPLESRVEALKSVVYQQKLGTSFEKMERFRILAEGLAVQLKPDVLKQTGRSAFLCKADLVTGMVGEFPELQGVMGREYALLQGEEPQVAAAIYEHYLPIQAGGELPSSDIGAFVSIADKLDTLCGCFGVGLIPTGSADPYALRRAVIGIINVVIEREYSISLSALIDRSLELLDTKLTRSIDDVKADSLEFFRGRFVNLMSDRYPSDVVEAVVSASFDNMIDAAAKISALSIFKDRDDFASLAIAFKRVCNIVREPVEISVNPDIFQDDAEQELFDVYTYIDTVVATKIFEKDYLGALSEIAAIKLAVDSFFDRVMVMDDDKLVRINRLALLQTIQGLFREIADFSKIAA